MHGRGIFTWEDDKSYTGSYENDKKCGLGLLTLPDGRKFNG